MTGFARAEGRFDGKAPFAWAWEAKSVNGKNLDVRVRVPHGFDSVELPARQAAAEALTRGTLNLSLTVTSDTASVGSGIDEAVLDALIDLVRRKTSQHGTQVFGNCVELPRLDGLMALARGRPAPEILDADTIAARDLTVITGLKTALAALRSARRQEGDCLAPVITGHLDLIAALCTEAGALAATQPAALKARLLQQVQELAGAVPALTAERLAQEAALLAVKSDIREELDRLAAHLGQARDLVSKGEPCGRRLDFLSQEFNREANTLCSKSADVALTRIGIALKTTIDQFREQIQNIE
ncbi:MAG: YicC family protein [Rhodospirillaceae bacterium]|nr:YicC family protein [Rhodospirillaceae bacterium]